MMEDNEGVAGACGHLRRLLREQGKIRAIVKAANVVADVPLPVDLKNGARKQFGREFFDCEPNGVRRHGEASVTKAAIFEVPAGRAPPRRCNRS
jgi:hypothetical protein